MTVFKLIALGVVILALMAAIGGAIVVHDNGVKTKALAPYRPLIDKCQPPNVGFLTRKRDPTECAQEWGDAVSFNVKLQEDVAKNVKETAECNLKVENLKKDSADMKANRASTEAKNKGKIDAAVVQAVSVERALAASKAGNREVSCAKSVAKVGSVLLPIATDRVRDFAPTDGTTGSGGPAPAPIRPGPDAMRIGK